MTVPAPRPPREPLLLARRAQSFAALVRVGYRCRAVLCADFRGRLATARGTRRREDARRIGPESPTFYVSHGWVVRCHTSGWVAYRLDQAEQTYERVENVLALRRGAEAILDH